MNYGNGFQGVSYTPYGRSQTSNVTLALKQYVECVKVEFKGEGVSFGHLICHAYVAPPSQFEWKVFLR